MADDLAAPPKRRRRKAPPLLLPFDMDGPAPAGSDRPNETQADDAAPSVDSADASRLQAPLGAPAVADMAPPVQAEGPGVETPPPIGENAPCETAAAPPPPPPRRRKRSPPLSHPIEDQPVSSAAAVPWPGSEAPPAAGLEPDPAPAGSRTENSSGAAAPAEPAQEPRDANPASEGLASAEPMSDEPQAHGTQALPAPDLSETAPAPEAQDAVPPAVAGDEADGAAQTADIAPEVAPLDAAMPPVEAPAAAAADTAPHDAETVHPAAPVPVLAEILEPAAGEPGPDALSARAGEVSDGAGPLPLAAAPGEEPPPTALLEDGEDARDTPQTEAHDRPGDAGSHASEAVPSLAVLPKAAPSQPEETASLEKGQPATALEKPKRPAGPARKPVRRTRTGKAVSVGAAQMGAGQLGALALGALAIGALAIGALAIGRLAIGRARVRRLEVDELVIGTVSEQDRKPPRK